ncbi:hypothetical protein FOZ62_027586 [Perkinsus olseni]|uniref:subtilisin n=1 Tax=Perkinsus olseni TaxID=32597 RepID=A0A7J6TJS8_PEROL|nr:hypothetical protein FOZ62_027586 [Perkinsus olseni]
MELNTLQPPEDRTLKYVHLQVVQTSPSTIGSDTLCKFVTEASSKLSLESNCAIDVDGGVFGDRVRKKTSPTKTPKPKGTTPKLPTTPVLQTTLTPETTQKPGRTPKPRRTPKPKRIYGHIDSDLHVNDYDAVDQKHFKWMKMGEVWQRAFPHVTRKAKVAVMDSGINWDDRDFDPLFGYLEKQSGGYLKGGWNFFDNSPFLTNKFNHGTQVCKILAAKANNSVSIAGMAQNVTLVPLQVVDDNERAPLSKLVAAIDMAINVRVDIAAISVGFKFSSREAAQRALLLQALHAAQEHNILVVSPAGNDGVDASDVLPCSFGGPRAICVAAMMDWKKLNVLHSKSNFGPKVDIAAFGYRILTGRLTDAPGGRLRSFSGTCASSAFAAGALAILISMGVDSGTAKQLIEESTDEMNYIIPDRYLHRIKGGALNVLQAVERAISWVSSKQRSLHDATGFASVE